MKFSHKFGYIALGGLLMLIGMIASSVFMPNLFAQKDKFGDIECTRLTIVDAEGKARVIVGTVGILAFNTDEKVAVWLNPDAVLGGSVSVYGTGEGGKSLIDSMGRGSASLSIGTDGGMVDVRGEDNIMWASLSTDEQGGAVSLHDKDGETRAFIGINQSENGGVVSVYGKDGKSEVRLGINADGEGLVSVSGKDGESRVGLSAGEDGGAVYVYGKDGESCVGLSTGEHGGGHVGVHDKSGETSVFLSTGEHGGTVSLYDKGGETRVVLNTDEHGGLIGVYGKGEGQAAMGINEYGNGAGSTWDKNGYRQ